MAILNNNQLRSLPKVELHRHLDGSVRFDTIVELAQKHNLDLGIKKDGNYRDNLWKKAKILEPMTDLEAVLDSFWTTQKVLCCYEAIKRVTFENIEDCYRDGVKLSELRFAPSFIAEGKKLDNDEIIEGVLDGMIDGLNKYDIQVALIHIVPRSLDLTAGRKATEDILRYKKAGHKGTDRIVGFDLAAVEADINIDDFIPLVEASRKADLGITVHSGEDTSAEYIKNTLNILHPDRIGHGIKAWGDQETIEMLKEQNVHLEISPTSNWLTKCVEGIETHPIAKLRDAGVSIGINSDDPQLMNIDLVNEYNICQKYYKLSTIDFNKINIDTLSHSFMPEEIRNTVLKKHFR
jgi:adenosine deaminase